MTVRDTTQGSDRICLRCTDPRQEAPASAPATCFELTSKKTGSLRELWNSAFASTKSMMLSYRYDTHKQLIADLYDLTHRGQPVTTRTIAHLCGGYAPYIWSPKKLESAASSISKDNYVVIATADDGMYEWTPQSHEFSLLGSKMYYRHYQQHREKLKQDLANDVSDWLWSGGVQCYLDELVYQAATTFELSDPVNEPAPSKVKQRCTATQQSGVDQEWEWINRHLTEIGEWVVKQYVERPKEAPSFLFCPEIAGVALASYSGTTRSIYFYLDLLQHTFASPSGDDQLRIVQAVAAHEVGHHRHEIEAGAGEMQMTGDAMIYGLPTSIVDVLGEVLDEHDMPPACDGQYLEALRQKHGLSIPTSTWHAPTTSELVAMLYEVDQIMKDGAPPAWQDGSLQHCLDISHTLARYYKAFPGVALELGWLHSLVMLDPKLGPAAKEIGFSMLREIIRQLPDDAMLEFPADCNAPVDRAGLTDAQRAQLPKDWCDFPAFVRRVRRSTSR